MNSSVAVQDRPRVLIADDEPVIAETMCRILDLSGFETVARCDGQSAIDTARVWTPDVFLGDVLMPGMNGIEAAIQIQRMIPKCRILLISSQAGVRDLMEDDRRRGYDFEVVVKPVHPTELLKRLRALIVETPKA